MGENAWIDVTNSNATYIGSGWGFNTSSTEDVRVKTVSEVLVKVILGRDVTQDELDELIDFLPEDKRELYR